MAGWLERVSGLAAVSGPLSWGCVGGKLVLEWVWLGAVPWEHCAEGCIGGVARGGMGAGWRQVLGEVKHGVEQCL